MKKLCSVPCRTYHVKYLFCPTIQLVAQLNSEICIPRTAHHTRTAILKKNHHPLPPSAAIMWKYPTHAPPPPLPPTLIRLKRVTAVSLEAEFFGVGPKD